MFILHMFYWLKRQYKKSVFSKNAIIGKNFTCGDKSSCINKSGEKKNIQIGKNCDILARIYVGLHGKVSIGDYTTIRGQTNIICSNSVEIEDHVIISHDVSISDNNNHPTSPETRYNMCESGFYSNLWDIDKSESKPVHIGPNVWICQNCIILKGVSIGKGSIVGAGSIVTKDIPEYVIAAGNPAVVVKKIK